MPSVHPAESRPGGVRSLLERVMAARAYPDDPRSRDLLHAPRMELFHLPRTLPGATAVAVRLEAAVRSGSPVAVYGDYDADGITATAILWRVIRAASPGADVRYYVPDRIDEGYGLNDGALASLAAEGVRTVVTVDCGVSAAGPARRAAELGLELLVTDHHHAEEGEVAAAAAIAHPSLPGRDPAPFTGLCGAAVAFKVAVEFARAWCGGDRIAEVLQRELRAAMPLVAIGTVADVVPLVDENRVFVKLGLEGMHRWGGVGIRALLSAAEIDRGQRVDASDIGFRLGPRLNAVGRLGHAAEAVELLVTEDAGRARAIVAMLDELNERRRQMDQEFLEQARSRIEADPSLRDGGAIVLADARWHEGVVGIVAAKVAEQYGRPAILLALRDDGTAKGSGRSIEGIDILAAVRRSAGDLLVRGGGHAFALGLTVRAGDVEELARRVSAECAAIRPAAPHPAGRRYDAEALAEEMTVEAVRALEILRPFGRGNPDPAFMLRAVRPVSPPNLFGSSRRHVEFYVPGGARAVWWGAADRAGSIRQGVPVDVVVRPSIDTYRGSRRVQLVVDEVRPAAT